MPTRWPTPSAAAGPGRDRRAARDRPPRRGRRARRRRGRGRGRGRLAAPARGRGGWTLERVYRSTHRASLDGQARPRWDLIKGRHYGKSVTIATRGCPHRCDYCTIPLLYGPRTMRYRPVDQVVREVAGSPTRAVVFWDDNIGANPRYSKELFPALAPLGKWWTSQCTARPRTTRSSSAWPRPADARRCSWASSRSRRRASTRPTSATTASPAIAG